MLPGAAGQGRAAQLVNPLRANSRFANPVMISGRAKCLVAGCDGRATRRSGWRLPAGDRPMGSGPAAAMDRFSWPPRHSAGVDRAVHHHWLAWTGLCARHWLAPGPGPAAARGPAAAARSAPGRTRGPAGLVPAVRRTGPAPAARTGPRPGPARKYLASRPAPGRRYSIKWMPESAHRHTAAEFNNAWPLIKAAQCMCPAQFTYHGVVGVIQ